MKRFCELIEDEFPPALLESTLRERLGNTFDFLCQRGVFVPAGIAEAYPCPAPGGEGCPRRVVENDDGTYDAVCGMDSPGCEDVVGLSPADLEVHRLDLEGLARFLCEAGALDLRFDGRLIPPYAFRIGDLVKGTRYATRVYFAARPSHPTFGTLIGWVRAAAGAGGAVLLVPTFRSLPSDIESRHDDGLRFVALDRALSVREGRAVLALEEPLAPFPVIRERPDAYGSAAHGVAFTHEDHGGRTIYGQDYGKLVACARNFDLFVDGTGDKVRVHRRENGHRAKTAVLTAAQFKMLLGYVERAAVGQAFSRPIRLGVTQQSADAALQIFKRMRRAVDTQLKDQTYRLFKHRRVYEGGGGEYAFAPEAEVRYCILAPPPR